MVIWTKDQYHCPGTCNTGCTMLRATINILIKRRSKLSTRLSLASITNLSRRGRLSRQPGELKQWVKESYQSPKSPKMHSPLSHLNKRLNFFDCFINILQLTLGSSLQMLLLTQVHQCKVHGAPAWAVISVQQMQQFERNTLCCHRLHNQISVLIHPSSVHKAWEVEHRLRAWAVTRSCIGSNKRLWSSSHANHRTGFTNWNPTSACSTWTSDVWRRNTFTSLYTVAVNYP